MTGAELRRWIGLAQDDPRQVLPAVVAGMADVPYPGEEPADAHIDVFAAFLRCMKDEGVRLNEVLTRPEGGDAP